LGNVTGDGASTRKSTEPVVVTGLRPTHDKVIALSASNPDARDIDATKLSRRVTADVV
jgi:hypothetical protein